MARSWLYDSCLLDIFRGQINVERDPVKVMFVSARYRPDQENHSRLSDVAAYEAEGPGYPAGGVAVKASIEMAQGNVFVLTFAEAALPKATLTAHYAVYYVDRGDPADSELLACVPFGAAFTSTNGPYSIDAVTFRLRPL